MPPPAEPPGDLAGMFIAPVDATLGEDEWRPFVEVPSLRPPGRAGRPDRDLPVVVPTQFVLEGDTVWLHLVRANPVFGALAENPRVLLSVADDWAFIPSAWKAIGDEDPALGIPTTYYGAVQLVGTATVYDERTAPGAWRPFCGASWRPSSPDVDVADPAESHAAGCSGSSGSPSPWSRCRPSSSTAATSTRPTGWPWSSTCTSAARPATTRRPRTCVRRLEGLSRPTRLAVGVWAATTAAARLASVAAISSSACSALWSPMTRATVANHFLRWSTHDSVTRQPAVGLLELVAPRPRPTGRTSRRTRRPCRARRRSPSPWWTSAGSRSCWCLRTPRREPVRWRPSPICHRRSRATIPPSGAGRTRGPRPFRRARRCPARRRWGRPWARR